MNRIRQIMITGASRGIGRAIALDLASTYKVVGVSRTMLELPSHYPYFTNILYRSGVDFAKVEDIDSLVGDLTTCDALINNVGIAYDGILATQSLGDIERIIQTNLVSTIYLTKLFLRERLAVRQPGVVVTIGSIVSTRGYRGLAVYSATKGALGSFTRSLAREMGAKGFRFNTVLPGFVETDMSSKLSAFQRNQIIRRTPLGRLGTVEDVVPVVRFLLSDDAGFITGQEIIVDGGLTA